MNPVANFTYASPIAVGASLNINDLSTAGNDDAYIIAEEWNYSTDGENMWTDATATPPQSFDKKGMYAIRLRVDAVWKEGTPEYNEAKAKGLPMSKWSNWKTV